MFSQVGSQQLSGVDRCPHCAIATPLFYRVWFSETAVTRRDNGASSTWAAYACSSCGSIVLAQGYPTPGQYADYNTWRVIPEAKNAHEDIPQPARRFLQQAMDTLHAPDAAAVMAGAAVDAMLKQQGFADGSLYKRIDEALASNVLTRPMAEWAHAVRLGSNRPRHADADNPHVSAEEAQQSVEFAEALGTFLYVLTTRIARGIEAANQASTD
ncbi:DUF4145 domain-containing protein [Brevundimonas intermedia]|uniref:DUF4145 domain-containing protein n=1 Tax=Brevundimonas intermedia TaxID=74315 RepID=UPI003209A70A